MKNRFDAWTDEQDRLLVETVLRHVREGSTQLKAFDEAGDAMDRTGAACGFRWNKVLRQKHEEALREARRDRKKGHKLPNRFEVIDKDLMKDLMIYSLQTNRMPREVIEEALKDYLQGVGAK